MQLSRITNPEESYIVGNVNECILIDDKRAYEHLIMYKNPPDIEVQIGNSKAVYISLKEAIQATIDTIEKDMPLNDIDLDHLVATALKMKVADFKNYDEIINFVFDYLVHCYYK
jgi:hypothetical protein